MNLTLRCSSYFVNPDAILSSNITTLCSSDENSCGQARFSHTLFGLIRGLRAEANVYIYLMTRAVWVTVFSTNRAQLTDTSCPQFTDRPMFCWAQRLACGVARRQQTLQVQQKNTSRIHVRTVGMCVRAKGCVCCVRCVCVYKKKGQG